MKTPSHTPLFAAFYEAWKEPHDNFPRPEENPIRLRRRSLPVLAMFAIAALFTFNPQLSTVHAQGALTPSGAPAPTMKTLQQVEPRIDLQNAPTLAVDTTNASYQFVINQPGSYYLSANLGVTKTNGIQINTEGVTLDLNGFEISRASGSGGNGIEIAGTSHRTSVRNGSITGFAYGVNSLLVPGGYARGCAFRELAVSGCTSAGILAGDAAVLESCRAHDNSGTYGIHARSGSTLSHCTGYNNSVTFGISAGAGSTLSQCSVYFGTGIYGILGNFSSTLSHCTAYNQTGTYGIYAGIGSTLSHCSARNQTGTYGLYADAGSTLSDCSASNNTGTYGIFADNGSSVSHCSAYENTGDEATSAGIGAGTGCTISHCSAHLNSSTAETSTPTTGMGFDVGITSTIQNSTAAWNEGDGIRLAAGSVVRDNTCDNNGFDGDGAGIHVRTGSGRNRVEGNNVTNNDHGIDVDSPGNFIIKNTATANTQNYSIVGTNKVGPIILAPVSSAINGSVGGAGVGTTDPWANFSY